MQYVGSKRRLARDLLPIMLSVRKPGQWWVEPFVGGANMIDKVHGNRIGNDANEYIIALYKAIQNGYVPPSDVSEKLYYDIRKNRDKYPKELVGFVGVACSFGGKWFGSYARNKKNQNYALRSRNSILRQSKYIKDVKFTCCDYKEMQIPEKSVVYCDPPYLKLSSGSYLNQVDHDEFWQWCRDLEKAGHIVFISEYQAPEDFVCVKEIECNTTLNDKHNLAKRTERLFIHKNSNAKRKPIKTDAEQVSLFQQEET